MKPCLKQLKITLLTDNELTGAAEEEEKPDLKDSESNHTPFMHALEKPSKSKLQHVHTNTHTVSLLALGTFINIRFYP